MKELAIITLSHEGLKLAEQITGKLTGDLFVHCSVQSELAGVRYFSRVAELSAEIFSVYSGLVYIMPSGVVMRALAPLLRSKYSDPAVVVMDVLGRYAISFLSGHEGGANALALLVSNLTGAEPVITTTTEVVKRYIIGIGCRKGIAEEVILEGIDIAVTEAGIAYEDIRYLATVELKAAEPGLLKTAERLAVPLRIISSAQIRNTAYQFGSSEFVEKNIGIKGVAEPAALLGGRRTKLILPRISHNGMTAAVARECSE